MIKLPVVLLLATSFLLVFSDISVARKKQPLKGSITCACACFSDTPGQVKLRRDVKTTVNGDLFDSVAECQNLNGGGCRYSNAIPGTLSSCQAQ